MEYKEEILEKCLPKYLEDDIKALKEDNKKINYFDYISSLGNEDCNKALLRVFPKINMNVVNDIVDNTDMISSIRKEFYKKMLMNRYNKILKYSYDKLCNNKY